MAFKKLISHPDLLKAIQELGYTAPTPIQEQAIPVIAGGADLRASAQTGTGKTGAFLLPILDKLANSQTKGLRLLILVPTRELAMQVAAEAGKFSRHLPNMKTVCVYGGAPYQPQLRQLSKPYDILVATPGRLMDFMQQRKINFSKIEVLILDEADRMLDMGFIGPVEEIAATTPKGRQTLMFSATMPRSVLKLSQRLLTNPVEIAVAPTQLETKKIEQKLYHVDNMDHKNRLLEHLLKDEAIEQVIVFSATKHQADQLVKRLYKSGERVAALHGGMRQNQRTRTLSDLRKKMIRVLVATDVAARGIDVSTISHVINFDLPGNDEDYVHRIGRTGRAGATGVALSFAAPKDSFLVRSIEKYTGQKMELSTVPGLEPKAKPQFQQEGQNRRPQGPKRNSPQNKRSFSKRRFR